MARGILVRRRVISRWEDSWNKSDSEHRWHERQNAWWKSQWEQQWDHAERVSMETGFAFTNRWGERVTLGPPVVGILEKALMEFRRQVDAQAFPWPPP